MIEGIVATSYAAGDKFYIDPMKLLPLARFLPQPKGAKGAPRGGGPHGGSSFRGRGNRGGSFTRGRRAPRGRGFGGGNRGGFGRGGGRS